MDVQTIHIMHGKAYKQSHLHTADGDKNASLKMSSFSANRKQCFTAKGVLHVSSTDSYGSEIKNINSHFRVTM